MQNRRILCNMEKFPPVIGRDIKKAESSSIFYYRKTFLSIDREGKHRRKLKLIVPKSSGSSVAKYDANKKKQTGKKHVKQLAFI